MAAGILTVYHIVGPLVCSQATTSSQAIPLRNVWRGLTFTRISIDRGTRGSINELSRWELRGIKQFKQSLEATGVSEGPEEMTERIMTHLIILYHKESPEIKSSSRIVVVFRACAVE